jgi:excisionase family DNA binding protein
MPGSMSRTRHLNQDTQTLWTVTQAASFLRVSERQIRRYIGSGRLPAYRLGRAMRIRPEDVERLLAPVGGPVPGDLNDFISEATS